jgi:hypothetical protein
MTIRYTSLEACSRRQTFNNDKALLHLGESKNTLNTTLKKMGRLDKIIVFSVLIIVVILVCDFLVTLWQELGRPSYLENIIGLTHLQSHSETKNRKPKGHLNLSN